MAERQFLLGTKFGKRLRRELTLRLFFLGKLILEGLMGFAGKAWGYGLMIFLKAFLSFFNHYYNVIVPELAIFLLGETYEK